MKTKELVDKIIENDWDMFKDGYVPDSLQLAKALEAAATVIKKRKRSGHNDTCSYSLAQEGEYECDCSHDFLIGWLKEHGYDNE